MADLQELIYMIEGKVNYFMADLDKHWWHSKNTDNKSKAVFLNKVVQYRHLEKSWKGFMKGISDFYVIRLQDFQIENLLDESISSIAYTLQRYVGDSGINICNGKYRMFYKDNYRYDIDKSTKQKCIILVEKAKWDRYTDEEYKDDEVSICLTYKELQSILEGAMNNSAMEKLLKSYNDLSKLHEIY